MSLTNILQVSCLACNAKVETSSTKNIYKTAFADTGVILAPFILTTLSLDAAHLRNPHLCLQCLNLFGRLEQAQRKVKSIKSAILKKFSSSHRGNASRNITVHNVSNNANRNITVHNVVQDSPTKSEVSFTKRKVVITQCMRKKLVNISSKKPDTNNSVMINNLDTKKTCVMRIKNNYASVGSIDLKLSGQSSGALSQSNMKKNVNLKVEHLPPSLQDHQYTQFLPAESQIDASPKTPPVQQQRNIVKIVEKIPEQKDTEPSILENPVKMENIPNCDKEESTLKDVKPNSKLYMCEKCGKVYQTQKTLKLHFGIHNGNSPYSCTVCNKQFTQNCTLKKHMIMHAEDRNFVCDICSKKFIHRNNFLKHKLAHNQEKIYKCHLCPITFKRMAHLNRHLRIHSGQKRFSCGVCGKMFFERYNVLSHMKIHDPNRLKEIETGQKRVIERRCERCNINFASAREYVVHLHSHTPGNTTLYKENNLMNGA